MGGTGDLGVTGVPVPVGEQVNCKSSLGWGIKRVTEPHSTGGDTQRHICVEGQGGRRVRGSGSGSHTWPLALGPQWSSPVPVAHGCLSNLGIVGAGDLVRREAGDEEEKEKAGRKERVRKGKGEKGGC